MTIRTLCYLDSHTFLCKFWHFQMAVSCLLLGLFTPNFVKLGLHFMTMWINSCLPQNLQTRPSRFENRQLHLYKIYVDKVSF